MALSQIQINEIKRQAKLKGYSDEQIASSIASLMEQHADKQQTRPSIDTSQSRSQTAAPMSQPTPPVEQSQGNFVSNFFKTLFSTGQDPAMVQKQEELTGFKKVAQAVADAAPAVVGTVAGIAGGALGAAAGGVGALPGGAAGTAVGVAAGKAFENAIEDLIGTQDQTPLEQVKEQAVEAGTAAALDFATGKVLSAASPFIKSVFKKVGGAVIEKGDDLALRAIRPSPSQQQRFLQKTGQEIKDFAIEKGLFKKGVEQSDELIAPIQAQFDDIAKNSNLKISSQMVVNKFDEAIGFLRSIPVSKLHTLADALEENKALFMKQYGKAGSIGADVLTQIRKNVDSIIPKSAWTKEPLDQAVNSFTRSAYQEAIQQAADEAGMTAGGKSLKELGQELSKLYSFREIAAAQQYLGQGSLPVGIVKALGLVAGGGFGATQGNSLEERVRNAAIGAGLVSMANNPKVISFVTKQLLKNGDIISKLPEKQKAKFVTEVFRRSLSNLMALKLNELGGDESVSSIEDGEINTQGNAQIPDGSSTTKQPTNGNGSQTNDNKSQINPPNGSSIPQEQAMQPFGGRSKQELMQLAIAQGATLKDLKELSSMYDMVFGQEEDSLKTLLDQRKQLTEAGFSTGAIDQKLQSLGFNPTGTGKQEKMTEKERLFENAATAAEQALTLLDGGKAKTGFGQGALGKVGEKIGTNSRDQQRYRSTIALARTTARNALLGANMTAGEMESIQSFIPEFNDAPEVAKEKLETFIELMRQFSGTVVAVDKQQ
jgi:hypothetical protein